MGFMAGFAEGFANTFNAMENRRENAKSDMFKISYDAFIRNKSKYEEDEKSDKARIQAAKAAVLAAGPNVPTSAWEHAYQLLAGGMSMENTVKQLGKYQFGTQSTPAMGEEPFTEPTAPGMVNASIPGLGGVIDPRNPQGFETAQPMTDDGTMAAGLDTAVTPVETKQVAQSDPTQITGLFGQGGLLDPESVKARQMQGASNNVMKAAGVDQATFDKYNAGYQSPVGQGIGPDGVSILGVSDDANSMGPGGIFSGDVDSNDKYIGTINGRYRDIIVDPSTGKMYNPDRTPLTADEVAEVKKSGGLMTNSTRTSIAGTQDDIFKAQQENNKQLVNTKSMLADMKDLSSLVKSDGTSIANSAAISTFTTNMIAEANAVIDQITTAGGGDNDLVKAEKDLSAKVADQLKGLGGTASNASKVASKIVALKFKLARAANGGGTLTQRDVDDQLQQLVGTSDPTIFQQKLNMLANAVIRDYDFSSNALNDTILSTKSQSAGFSGSVVPTSKDFLTKEDKEWLGTSDTDTATPGAPTDSKELAKGAKEVRISKDMSEALAKSGVNIAPGTRVKIAVDPSTGETVIMDMNGNEY